VVRTDAERQEVADTAQQTWLFTVVVEEAFRVELTRVVPRRLVEMNCLVVTDNDRVTRDHVAA